MHAYHPTLINKNAVPSKNATQYQSSCKDAKQQTPNDSKACMQKKWSDVDALSHTMYFQASQKVYILLLRLVYKVVKCPTKRSVVQYQSTYHLEQQWSLTNIVWVLDTVQ